MNVSFYISPNTAMSMYWSLMVDIAYKSVQTFPAYFE